MRPASVKSGFSVAPFDSHPTLEERITAAEGFPESIGSHDPTSASELLTDGPAVEEKLTAILTQHILQQMAQQ